MTQQNQNTLMQKGDTNRLEAFSDGVFAIAITLLILNIRVPQLASGVSLDQALRAPGEWLTYLAFLLSFLTILNFWVNHHNIFRYITRIDHWMLFINGLVLLGVVILPFPTALLAQYFTTSEQITATVVYAGVFTYLGLAYTVLWNYAAANMRLLDPRLDPVKIRNLSRRYLIVTPPFYITAFIMVFEYPVGALIIYFLLMIFYMLPSLSLPSPEKLYRKDMANAVSLEAQEFGS